MIIAARRAPAAAGGPHPRRISAREVQRHALPGWLAWQEPLGEWTLRAGGGFTRRANSCHAVGDPGMPVQQAAEQIIRFALAHDISPLAQVIEGSPEEHALRRLGWVSTDQPTAVLVSRLADFLGGRRAEPAAKITETLRPDWEEAYQLSRPNAADPAIVRMILEGNPPRRLCGRGRPWSGRSFRARRDCPGAPERGLARTGSIWTRSRSSPTGPGDGDDGDTRTLGGSPGRALRLPSGGDCQRAGHCCVPQARLHRSPPLPLSGSRLSEGSSLLDSAGLNDSSVSHR